MFEKEKKKIFKFKKKVILKYIIQNAEFEASVDVKKNFNYTIYWFYKRRYELLYSKNND